MLMFSLYLLILLDLLITLCFNNAVGNFGFERFEFKFNEFFCP